MLPLLPPHMLPQPLLLPPMMLPAALCLRFLVFFGLEVSIVFILGRVCKILCILRVFVYFAIFVNKDAFHCVPKVQNTLKMLDLWALNLIGCLIGCPNLVLSGILSGTLGPKTL